MNFIELAQSLGSNIWIYGGAFILVLSILVFIHEWGHYIVARLCGVKVEVFSIGFGKEIAGFHDRAGTRWKFCLVPLGGYVKMFGDVDPASVVQTETIEDEKTHHARPMTEAERSVAFFAKPVWKRAAVVAAGPGVNYIFAIILMTLLFTFNGQPVTPPVAGAVIGGSSAEKAGFQPHDVIRSIDGRTITDFDDIRTQMLIGLDRKVRFEIERDGKILFIDATPEKIEVSDRFGFKHSRGLLGLIGPRYAIDIKAIQKIDGVAFTDVEAVRAVLLEKLGATLALEVKGGDDKSDAVTIRPDAEANTALGNPEDPQNNLLFVADKSPEVFVKYPVHEAFGQALSHTWRVTSGTVEALGHMVMGTRSTTELGGVIRIGALAGDVAKQGVIAFIFFTALLSINLGLINLFPIPILDGGHLVFYAFEAAMGKPVPSRVQEYAFGFGLFFLVCVMVYANLSDIVQLIL